jgi:hypothetical protein
MIDEGDCGAIGGMKIGRGKRSTRRKPAPAPLCPPQIPYDQTRARTLAAAVRSQRLTAWAMTGLLTYMRHIPVSWSNFLSTFQEVTHKISWLMIREIFDGGRGLQKKWAQFHSHSPVTYASHNFLSYSEPCNPQVSSTQYSSSCKCICVEHIRICKQFCLDLVSESNCHYVFCIHFVSCVLYCYGIFVCCVLFECGVLFCVMYVICVLCLIVVSLPPGKNPFAV